MHDPSVDMDLSEEAIFRSDVTKKLDEILERLQLLEEANADVIRDVKRARLQAQYLHAKECHPGASVTLRAGHMEVSY